MSEIDDAIKQAASSQGVDFNLLRSFAEIESGGHLDAVSSTNVKGLFQITGDTFNSYATAEEKVDRYSARSQANVAARYIRDLQKKFNDEKLVAVAYNAGPETARLTQELVKQGIPFGEAAHKAALRVFGTEAKAKETGNYASRLLKAEGKKYKDIVDNSPQVDDNGKQSIPNPTSDDFLDNLGPGQNDFKLLAKVITSSDKAKDKLRKLLHVS